MGYKGTCIHDCELKRVKMMNECDRCYISKVRLTGEITGKGCKTLRRLPGWVNVRDKRTKQEGRKSQVLVLYILSF